ncbi:E3 ubiquitin-protein ligase [Tetrabaena socialis]|uniref:E3 ubiquitin-protein ligase n=1 Tax=Tetrabaena socialis TaxID=47790 RepID=A0A2J8AHX2_9CHLO|nr:E3 ubiquitin-protein ligase [Tetrabaena socialis]|eukprot:PNH12118.1 E3 ubiquitin-protein ligase [Tetrabaena socialis]
MAYSSSFTSGPPPSWFSFVSVGGVASLAVSAVAAWGFGVLGTVLVVRKVVRQLMLRRQEQRLKRMIAQAVAARRAAAAAGTAPGGAAAGAAAGAGAEEGGDEARAPGMCVVCLDRDADIVFSGCGHMGTCSACSAQLSKCPICRVASRTIRVYRP